MAGLAVILYGYGGSLGNFEIFAESLARDLRSAGKKVMIQSVVRRDAFFDYLATPPIAPGVKIAELHVFSHSIGAGLFLAYGEVAAAKVRDAAFEAAVKEKRRITYDEAVNAEVGAILTDDLVRAPYSSLRNKIVDNLEAKATAKLWGCNSGIKNWIYNDNGTSDPTNRVASYYWRAFNERNVPKPSMAQALATYLQRKVYGASSGSHIEVLHKTEWVSSAKYKAAMGHYPSGALVHRLSPDRGEYDAYKP